VQQIKAAEKAMKEASKAEKEMMTYSALMQDDAMTSNKVLAAKYNSVEDAEDDFM